MNCEHGYRVYESDRQRPRSRLRGSCPDSVPRGERGEQNVTLETLRNTHKALNVKIVDLVRGIDATSHQRLSHVYAITVSV